MGSVFQEITPGQIGDNPFTLIGSQGMLVTAGSLKDFNTMTAGWGGLGVLWSKPVCFCFIRPTRHTFAYMEKGSSFTLSFFWPEYKHVLEYCGSHSGREVNKARETGLTPVEVGAGAVAYAEARLVLVAEKLYFQDLEPAAFLAAEIHGHYPKKDYHRLFVGEIVKVLKRQPST